MLLAAQSAHHSLLSNPIAFWHFWHSIFFVHYYSNGASDFIHDTTALYLES